MIMLKNLTKRDKELIKTNLKFFKIYYKEIYIGKCIYNKSIYVYWIDEINKEKNNFIALCENIHELNGWLYGMTQGTYYKRYLNDTSGGAT